MSENIKLNNNVFSSFPKYKLNSAENNNNLNKSTSNNYAKNEQDNYSKSKKILFGSTLASTILTVGLLSLLLAKGPHGSSFKKLSKVSDQLTDKILTNQNSSTKTFRNNTIFYARKGTKKTIEGLQAASNFTAIKDWLANKLLRKNKAGSKFADKSKSYFKKIVDKPLGKQYNAAEIKVKDLSSLLKHFKLEDLSNLSAADKMQKITIKDKTQTLEEWLEQLFLHSENLENVYDKNFSLGARKLRNTKRNSLLSNVSNLIEERFFKSKKSIFNLKNYKTYVTEDVTQEAQKTLRKDILNAKREVTNNIPAVHENIKTKLTNFSQAIKPSDNETREITQQIKNLLEEFKTCSGANEAQKRSEISTKISSNIKKIENTIKGNNIYSSKEQKNMLDYLKSILKSIEDGEYNSKGELEEIMTILNGLNKSGFSANGKKIITDSEYKEFSKLSSAIRKNLNKAAELEAGEYFLKQAELEVGSAPTDILSILFPLGAGIFAIGTSEDKDERISKTLTTCIPLVGTFAAFVYSTTRMFSGAKSLGFSLASGAILSKLGSYSDKLYKQYKNTGSISNVVKDEYTNFVTDINFINNQNKKEIKK